MTSHLIGFMRLKRRQGTAESFNVVSQLFLLPIRDGVLSFRASYGCVVYLSHKRVRALSFVPLFGDGLYSLFVRSASIDREARCLAFSLASYFIQFYCRGASMSPAFCDQGGLGHL